MANRRAEDANEETQAAFDAPQPVPHMASHLTNGLTNAAVSHSVVPDLMRVYESMTQSKTPHHGHLNELQSVPQGPPPLPQQQQDHSIPFYQPSSNAQHNWSYDVAMNNTSIPIPAPYQMPQDSEEPTQNRRSRKRSMPSESDQPSTKSSGTSSKARRRKSKKGGGTGDGKDKEEKPNDGRWSKRFTWPEELHRDFVSAIFDVGLKHSSPSAVLEHMPPHEQITTERIKSHLQKYRLHRQKSKKEFMSSYAATVKQMNEKGIQGTTSLAGGQVPAHLTYATRTLPDPVNGSSVDNHAESMPPPPPTQNQASQVPDQKGNPDQHEDTMVLPRLTEAEKQSPIGSSLGYLLGLYFSLKQQLDLQREQQRQAAAAAKRQQEQQLHSAATVFDSFVGEPQSTHHHHPQEMQIPASAAVASSTRSNLEENSMMKREMQNQMAFQNKMRALKQQELNKIQDTSNAPQQGHMQSEKSPAVATAMSGDNPAAEQQQQQANMQQHQQVFQGAGEVVGADTAAAAAAARDHQQGQNIGLEDDDFWNTDVVDEQLFEFLMNN